MSHLLPDELVDAVDNTLPSERRAHLNACDLCRRQVKEVRRTLQEVLPSEVPDPSPLFWTHLSDRVRKAIAEEPQPHASWLPAWVGWRIVAPVGALALMIAALVNAVPRASRAPDVPSIASSDVSATPSVSDGELFDDPSWQLVSDLAEDMDLDEESHAGFVIPGAIERAASDLNPAERAELLRLLRAELGRPES